MIVLLDAAGTTWPEAFMCVGIAWAFAWCASWLVR